MRTVILTSYVAVFVTLTLWVEVFGVPFTAGR